MNQLWTFSLLVHRDVKPQNILLKVITSNEVKALISDCDLCRKVPDGQRYVITQYGMAGTLGWIAPEMSEKTSEVVSTLNLKWDYNDVHIHVCILYIYHGSEVDMHFINLPMREFVKTLPEDYRFKGDISYKILSW